MGKLESDLFKNDPKLEACAADNSAHIHMKKNFVGEHVGKIQTALIRIDPSLKISAAELNTKTYRPSTADAVRQDKRARVCAAGLRRFPRSHMRTLHWCRMEILRRLEFIRC